MTDKERAFNQKVKALNKFYAKNRRCFNGYGINPDKNNEHTAYLVESKWARFKERRLQRKLV